MLAQQAGDAYEKGVVEWPDIDEETRWGRVANIMGAQMTKEQRSDAKLMLMYFFSCGQRRDLSANDFAEKKKAYLEDSEKAVAEGICNVQGVPLDTRATYPNTDIPNRNYQKPLQPFYQKVAFGIAKLPHGTEIKFLTVRLRNKQSQLKVPIEEPVMGRVNIRSEDEYHINCTSSTITRLQRADFPEVADINKAELLAGVSEGFVSDPIGLADWMDATEDLPFVMVEGDIVSDVTETSTGGLRFFLGDPSQDVDFAGINCFAPASDEISALGTGSRIRVLGYPTEGQDLEGNPQITLNANVVGVVYAVAAPDDMFEDPDYEV